MNDTPADGYTSELLPLGKVDDQSCLNAAEALMNFLYSTSAEANTELTSCLRLSFTILGCAAELAMA